MATPISQLKGTAAEIAGRIFGNAVLVWNETTRRWHGGDGVTAGGIPMARYDELNIGSLGYAQRTETGAANAVTAADVGRVIIGNRATAIVFNLDTASNLTGGFVAMFKNIGAGAMTVVPNGAEQIDGLNAAITVSTNASVVIKGDGTSFQTFLSNGDVTAAAIHNAASKAALVGADEFGVWDAVSGTLRKIALAGFWTQSKWRSRFIGEIVYVNTAVAGVDVPPSSIADTVWIELTAGLIASGFNNGKLTSESVTGSGTQVLATAVIAFAGSPMNGQTVDLLNTEGRIVRPSTSPGTKQTDAFQGHLHPTNAREDGLAATAGGTAVLRIVGAVDINTGVPIADGANGAPRTATETRMKNVGSKAYMRIA